MGISLLSLTRDILIKTQQKRTALAETRRTAANLVSSRLELAQLTLTELFTSDNHICNARRTEHTEAASVATITDNFATRLLRLRL